MTTSALAPSPPSAAGATRPERRASRASSPSGPFDLPTLQQRLTSLVRRVARDDTTLASTSAALGHRPRLAGAWK
jgi:hypothetical protein